MPLIQGDEKIETINSLDDQGMLTERLTDKAISFIEKNKSNPFFLYLAHPMPHVPINASSKFRGKSKQGLYGDVIQEVDANVGTGDLACMDAVGKFAGRQSGDVGCHEGQKAGVGHL